MSALLELLSLETNASEETLVRILTTAPRRYKVYQIAKRNGGFRTIAHPARELKVLQRAFLRQVLDGIPPSAIATAYVEKRGIKYNALVHATSSWILKLDFKDFFHSIVPADWDRVVRRTLTLKDFGSDRALIHKMLFWGILPKNSSPTCLSIGAPTSPSVSNLVCAKLDQWMINEATKLDIRVTRYADDITISGASSSILKRFEISLGEALRRNSGVDLVLNDKKRGLYGPGDRRMVTGLILTPEGRVSIGRERKREISSLIHRYSLNQLDTSKRMRTHGLLAFARSIEPAFFEAMKSKYSSEVIWRLMRPEINIDITLGDIEF